MIRVVHIDDSGSECATVELDDFTVEILYSGISVMLREAAQKQAPPAPVIQLSKEARSRRERVLNRICS
ncbi:MAG TPA: hypothetical protein VNG12_24575 [Acidimicrobiales bacterium]|nr:hypothetical protein [Acidimicrobiales bacterium]